MATTKLSIEPFYEIDMFVSLLLSSFEQQLVSIECMGRHPHRGQLLADLKRMIEYLDQKLTMIETEIETVIQEKTTEAMEQSAHLRDLVRKLSAVDSHNEELKHAASTLVDMHNDLVKSLGKIEVSSIAILSDHFKDLKNKLMLLSSKVQGVQNMH